MMQEALYYGVYYDDIDYLLIKPQVGTLYFKDGMLIRKASFMMILIGFFQLGVIFTKIRLFSIVSLPKIL